MSFGLHIANRPSRRGVKPAERNTAPLTAVALVLLAACIFDFSPYGPGYIGAFLADAQRWIAGVLDGIRVKM
jgi:hypothetical protein